MERLPDDPALLDRLRRGEKAAFNQAYETWRPRVHAFLLRLSGRAAIASELSQETWLRLASEAPHLAPDTVLSAWLFTVARNLYLSHRRWSLLDGSRIAEATLWRKDQKEEVTPEHEASSQQLKAKAEAAVASLPMKYREALLLVAVEHFEPTEAAKILGITPEAFRQRLSRGRELVREALREVER